MPLRSTSLLFALIILISACSKPFVVPRVGPEVHKMSCDELREDMRKALHFKRAARADDRFYWKHIFVVNAFVSWNRMNKAEKAAQHRLDVLEEIMILKKCPKRRLTPKEIPISVPPKVEKPVQELPTKNIHNQMNDMYIYK